MIDKLIIIPNEYNDIDNLRNVGITTFLLPLDDYSIGYNSFSIDQINKIQDKKYLIINRILTTKEIDELKKTLDKIDDLCGIYFEDLGLYEKFKNSKYELINYQNHFGTNYQAINYMLEMNMKSYVVPNDLTFNEIQEITKNVIKPIVLFIFGQSEVMYSRRKLLTNYRKHYNLEETDSTIIESVSKIKFDIKESDYGSYLFDHNYYNGCDLLTLDSKDIINYLINAQNIKLEKIIELIKLIKEKNYQLIEKIDPLINKGFLYKETIYRVKGDE